MPSNIFATTGTNVSILFLDASNDRDIVLIDASNLGEQIKDGKNQKVYLTVEDENKIINNFTNKINEEYFSIVLNYDDLVKKNYSFSAGQYFTVTVKNEELSSEEFDEFITENTKNLKQLFDHSKEIEKEILSKISELRYE